MQLFFIPEFPEGEIELDQEESRHIVKVLRKRPGDMIQFTNGKGMLADAVLTNTGKQNCSAKVVSLIQKDPMQPELHIAIAPTKNQDRFEWFVEKCTEIGITSITPLDSDHSERPYLKMDRLHKIMLSAMKQSNQVYLPKLYDLTSFDSFITTQNDVRQKYIAWCGDGDKTMMNEISRNANTVILIGPEGDFSSREITLALDNKYLSLSLGTNRLRTETAGILACAAFQTLNL